MSIFRKITILFVIALAAVAAIAYHSADLQSTADKNAIKQRVAEASNTIISAMTLGKDDASIESEANAIGLKSAKLPANAKELLKTDKQLLSFALFESDKTYYLQINYLDEIKTFEMNDKPENSIDIWLYLSLEIAAITLLYAAVIKILSPLKTVANAMNEFPNSEFQPLRIDGNDEVALLSKRFNEMAGKIDELLKEQELFLIQAGHELRTPITKAKIAAEMDTGEYAALYRKAFGELEIYTDELLKVQGLRSGKNTKSDTAFEIETALTKALEKLFLEDENEIEIEITENFTARGDIEYAVIILRNMLENALKYKDGGKVHIKANTDKIEITNSGKIAKSQNGGYGFGLMLCNEIARRVGWKFEIESSDGVVYAKLLFV